MEIVSSSNSVLLAGIMYGLILTILCLILSLTIDFLFGRSADREHVLSMGIICTVVSITQAYFDTTKWFDLLKGLLTIVGFSILFGYLKSKYESVRNYFNYTVWDFTSKEDN